MVLGLIVVGGLAAYSIYLQQDESIVAIEKATNPNYHCLEKWDYLEGRLSEDPNSKVTGENKDVFTEWLDAGCQLSYREWMPETHPDWDQMVIGENNRINSCGKYLRGEVEMSELDKELFESWNCEQYS